MISENVVTCFMLVWAMENSSMAPCCQRCLSLKECEGCEFVAPNNWWYVRHIATCDQYKALQPRVCGIITNESMMKVAHQHNISEATSTSCGMMKSLGKENPTLLFVKNLRKRLRESRDSLLGWYDANQLNATRWRPASTVPRARCWPRIRSRWRSRWSRTSTRTSTTNTSAAPMRTLSGISHPSPITRCRGGTSWARSTSRQASAFRDPIVESRAATTETQDNEIMCKIMFYLFENLQSIVYLSSIPVLSKVLWKCNEMRIHNAECLYNFSLDYVLSQVAVNEIRVIALGLLASGVLCLV